MALKFLSRKNKDAESKTVSEEHSGSAAAAKETMEPDTGEYAVFAPVSGNVVARENIPDAAFASGVLGDGVGIEPEGSEIIAPFDGEVTSVLTAKHAISLTGPGRIELLIHVGIDTVRMNGEGFEQLVAEGQSVRKGQKLLTFDAEKIRAAGFSPIVSVLVVNAGDYASCETKPGRAGAGDQIILVRK